MPELPEVETVRRTLERLIVGKTVDRVHVHLGRIVREPDDAHEFSVRLQNETVRQVERRGKLLKLVFDEVVLVSHLRMEGRYQVVPHDEPLEKHTHVVFHFTDGEDLRYRDVRQFGTMHLVKSDEVNTKTPIGKLGPEPLTPAFSLEWLQSELRRRTSRLKPLLLNQAFVAGLGNIYVDEALFAAGLHPERSVSTLSSDDVARLHTAIEDTLQRAIDAGGSSVRSYVNGEGEMGMFQLNIQAYGRAGEPCTRCGEPMTRLVVAGRGTHICKHCQR